MSTIPRAIQVIDLLARRGPLGVRAVAQQLELPLGSAHRILMDLAAESILERSATGEWNLSYRLLEIVGTQLERVQLPRLVRPMLEQLATDTRETTFLAVPSRDEIVYLDKVQTDLQLQLNVELGTRRPMHCTGLGKAILAFLPEAQQEQVLAAGPFRAFTPHTMTDAMLLRLDLERTRQRGYAIDREEIILGVHCVAVPILNHAGRAVGAISVAGTTPKTEGERFDVLVGRLKAAGEHVSRRLGFNHPANSPTPPANGHERGLTAALTVDALA
ncbi:MAG: IclR family transcriptional regulator [Chloroflexota bacterium]|nr:IclR family transcriptional regulator [Chloroflexota bacterium]